MRNAIALLSCSLLLLACGGEKSEYEQYYESDYKPDTTQVTGPVAQTKTGADATEGAAAPVSQFAKGEKLISLSDCLACHRVDEKLIGPSYVDVANKYEANDKNIDYLAGKIIEGGSGVWGEVAMTPHPNITKEDAREMAKYVLSLRKE